MVAIGATSALMNLNTDTFESLITNMFSKKGEKVVEVKHTSIKRRLSVNAIVHTRDYW